MHAGTLFGRMGDIQREPINSGTQHLYPSATIAWLWHGCGPSSRTADLRHDKSVRQRQSLQVKAVGRAVDDRACR